MARALLCLLLVAALAGPARAEPRQAVRVVGSSTMYTFASAVAEAFARTSGFRAPVIEATGTGGGFKRFCAGIGLDTPDIVTASRRMTRAERETCRANGVDAIGEERLGFDGVVLARARGATPLPLSRRLLWLALARRVPVRGKLVANPYETWNQVAPGLPDEPIRVYGPPPTSGTRDVLARVAMDGGCSAFRLVRELPPGQRRDVCRHMREDGAYVEAGEDDENLVRRLINDRRALGIVGFNALRRHGHLIRGVPLEHVAPTPETIAWGTYPLSRALYLYVKKAHLDRVPGLDAFVAAFDSPAAIGPDGYLTGLGLIPAAD